MDTQKLDAKLVQTVNACRGNERVNVFIRWNRPPRENDPDYEKFNIRGANGKRKVLTATLSINEIDTLSEMSDVIAITQSTTMHPGD